VRGNNNDKSLEILAGIPHPTLQIQVSPIMKILIKINAIIVPYL